MIGDDTAVAFVDPGLASDPAAYDFLARFLAGPTEINGLFEQRAWALLGILDPEELDARVLPALLAAVGWPSSEAWVADLDEGQVRRLIAAALPLWKIRGTRPSWVAIARVLVGRYVLVQEWHDRRAHTGTWGGPYLVPGLGTAAPGAGPYSYPEYVSDLWVEDPTSSADLDQLAGILGRFRPANERINVYRALFVDTGLRGPARWGAAVDPAAYAWDEAAGVLTSTGRVFEARAWTGDFSEAYWRNTIVDARARNTPGSVLAIFVAYADQTNFYRVKIDHGAQLVTIERCDGGTLTTRVSAPFTWGADAWIRWRVTHEVVSAGRVQIRVFFEGVQVVQRVELSPSPVLFGGGAAWGSLGSDAVDMQGFLVFPTLPDRVRTGPTP